MMKVQDEDDGLKKVWHEKRDMIFARHATTSSGFSPAAAWNDASNPFASQYSLDPLDMTNTLNLKNCLSHVT